MKVTVVTLALWLVVMAATDAATTKKRKVLQMTTAQKKKMAAKKQAAKKAAPQSVLQNLVQSIGSGQSFLYKDTPQVIEYQGDEDSDFEESRMARIVQFYSPVCVSRTCSFVYQQTLDLMSV